eukprot:12926573-Prorocentrum_lima.AAC.1
MVYNHYIKYLSDIEPVRLLRATFRSSAPLTVIVAYAPTATRSDVEKDSFYDALDTIARKWYNVGPTLILSDMNARIQACMEGEETA